MGRKEDGQPPHHLRVIKGNEGDAEPEQAAESPEQAATRHSGSWDGERWHTKFKPRPTEASNNIPWDIHAIVDTLGATAQIDYTGKYPLILNKAPAHPLESGLSFVLTTLDLDPSNAAAHLRVGPTEIILENVTDIKPEKGNLRLESVSETVRTILQLNPNGSFTMEVTTTPSDLSRKKR